MTRAWKNRLFYLGMGFSLGLFAAVWFFQKRPGPQTPKTQVTKIMNECLHDASVFRCVKFLDNYDGDTIKVSITGVHPLIGSEITVRVLGIDTPERKTKNKCEAERANEAREVVKKFLKQAKSIELHKVGRDKYFRILADVRADGKSLSELLIRRGLAYSYDGGAKLKVDWCRPKE